MLAIAAIGAMMNNGGCFSPAFTDTQLSRLLAGSVLTKAVCY
jgi:hypothetical protein